MLDRVCHDLAYEQRQVIQRNPGADGERTQQLASLAYRRWLGGKRYRE